MESVNRYGQYLLPAVTDYVNLLIDALYQNGKLIERQSSLISALVSGVLASETPLSSSLPKNWVQLRVVDVLLSLPGAANALRLETENSITAAMHSDVIRFNFFMLVLPLT